MKRGRRAFDRYLIADDSTHFTEWNAGLVTYQTLSRFAGKDEVTTRWTSCRSTPIDLPMQKSMCVHPCRYVRTRLLLELSCEASMVEFLFVPSYVLWFNGYPFRSRLLDKSSSAFAIVDSPTNLRRPPGVSLSEEWARFVSFSSRSEVVPNASPV